MVILDPDIESEPKISLMFTVAIFVLFVFELNIYHRHRQHLNMTGQKIKHWVNNFKDISLSQKESNYSGLIKKKSNNIFNLYDIRLSGQYYCGRN